MPVNWNALLEMVAPLGGALAAGEGNHGAFLSGWNEGASVAAQERERKAHVAQAQRAKGGQFKLDMMAKLLAMDDPGAFQQMKDAASSGAQSMFGMDPAEWQDVRFPESTSAAKRLKTLTDYLASREKEGHDLDALAESGSTIQPEGWDTPIRVDQALDLVRSRPVSASGQRVPIPKKAPPSAGSELDRAAALRRQAEVAMEAGNGPDADRLNAEYRNLRETKRELGESGREPNDPRVDDINLTLKELQAEALRTRANQPPKPVPELPPITQRRVQQLEDGFKNEPAVKRANTIAEGYSFVNSLSNDSQNPADDQALIYAFAKAMDPESVVREGEYATVQKYSQSWIDSFKFNAQRVLSNSEFLSPQSRQQIKATIRAKFAASKSSYDNARKQYIAQLNRVSGQNDGESRLIDYASAYPSSGAPAAGGATGGPAVGERRMINGQPGEWDGKGWKPVQP